jgi:hypothetical protein
MGCVLWVQVGVLLSGGASNTTMYPGAPLENNTMVNVSIVANYGHITLPLSVPSLRRLHGSGYQDRAVVISGSITDVNLALSRIVYRSDLNWNSLHSIAGFDVVTLQADDQGLDLPLVNNMTYDLVRVRVCARAWPCSVCHRVSSWGGQWAHVMRFCCF